MEKKVRRALSPEKTRYNRMFWNNRKNDYPFHVRTDRPPPIKPDKWEPFDFIAVPVSDTDYYWGFKTATEREKFLLKYEGQKMPEEYQP